jgi:GT2 family glycosyltransferase
MLTGQQSIHPPAGLSISCVIYDTDSALFFSTIQSLADSCKLAKEKSILNATELFLIENAPNQRNHDLLQKIANEYSSSFSSIKLISGHGNVGYGQGNNLSILHANSDYHLVLNPDVILDKENISIAIDFMNRHPDVGLLTPDAENQFGQREYIAKRYPSVIVLLARALNINLLTRLLESQLARYEYRDKIPGDSPLEVQLASGCYMLLRTPVVQKAGGFTNKYFMYFEDFDLSLKIQKTHRIIHHPSVRIIHHGGKTARKGLKHIYYFFKSFVIFLCYRPK